MRAEASGKAAAGRQPPSRLRNQNRDGAYASEKSSAAMISEVMVAPLMSAALKLFAFNDKKRQQDCGQAKQPGTKGD